MSAILQIAKEEDFLSANTNFILICNFAIAKKREKLIHCLVLFSVLAHRPIVHAFFANILNTHSSTICRMHAKIEILFL